MFIDFPLQKSLWSFPATQGWDPGRLNPKFITYASNSNSVFNFPPNAKELFWFIIPWALNFGHICMARRACLSWVYLCHTYRPDTIQFDGYLSHRLVDKLLTQGADKLSMGHPAALRRTEPMLQVRASTTRWCHILGTNTHQRSLILLPKLPLYRHVCKNIGLKRARKKENS